MKNEGLQKLTEFQLKVESLLKQNQISPKDLQQFSTEERDRFYEVVTEKFNNSKGTERDRLIKQIDLITHTTFKNELWEANHLKITGSISNLMARKGVMPSRTDIAKESNLSRQTVNKHLKEYSTHPLFLEQEEQFRFMTSRVLAKLFDYAINNGDVRAAKLFLSVVGSGEGNSGNSNIKNQNNFIQINGMVLSQENIKQLKPEQLRDIESILKTTLSKK